MNSKVTQKYTHSNGKVPRSKGPIIRLRLWQRGDKVTAAVLRAGGTHKYYLDLTQKQVGRVSNQVYDLQAARKVHVFPDFNGSVGWTAVRELA